MLSLSLCIPSGKLNIYLHTYLLFSFVNPVDYIGIRKHVNTLYTCLVKQKYKIYLNINKLKMRKFPNKCVFNNFYVWEYIL